MMNSNINLDRGIKLFNMDLSTDFGQVIDIIKIRVWIDFIDLQVFIDIGKNNLKINIKITIDKF